jgi:PAS domain S-box-containing protein
MPRTAPLNGAILETGVSLKVSVVPRELQIEREWSASERAERLARLLTLSYEPMLVWQLNGPIEVWNTGAERLYGFAPEEAIGHSSHALLQTKFPVEFDELITQLQNERYWSGELRHICKDGREVIVESRLQLLDDAKKLSCC